MQIDGMVFLPHAEEMRLEDMRKMYLEALILAKQNPNEHTISVVSKLREQLQQLARCSPLVIPDIIREAKFPTSISLDFFYPFHLSLGPRSNIYYPVLEVPWTKGFKCISYTDLPSFEYTLPCTGNSEDRKGFKSISYMDLSL